MSLERGVLRLLQVLTPTVACCSGGLAGLAVGGGRWLLTEERFPNPAFSNGSSPDQYLVKRTISGLFLLCQTQVGAGVYRCSYIDYLGQGSYRADPNDATLAIPYTAVRASPLLLCGCAVLAVAETLCLYGLCTSGGPRLSAFAAGVTFIAQGIMMMTGCVMYIATLNGEVWEKLRPKSMYSPPRFTYTYGGHFALMVASFTCSELTGICLVMLFICWHKRDWKRRSNDSISEVMHFSPCFVHDADLLQQQYHLTTAPSLPPCHYCLCCHSLPHPHSLPINSSTSCPRCCSGPPSLPSSCHLCPFLSSQSPLSSIHPSLCYCEDLAFFTPAGALCCSSRGASSDGQASSGIFGSVTAAGSCSGAAQNSNTINTTNGLAQEKRSLQLNSGTFKMRRSRSADAGLACGGASPLHRRWRSESSL